MVPIRSTHASPAQVGESGSAAAARGSVEHVVSSRAEGEAQVASMCFRYGPPRLIGVEIEYTVHDVADPWLPLDPGRLANALGAHTPTTLCPDSPAVPLPGGSSLTLEPGGQVEVSTVAQRSLRELATVVDTDVAYLVDLLAVSGLRLGTGGIDAFRRPARLLSTERYAAMERRFDRKGDAGRTMMCSTAALQVCLDVGEEQNVAARWAAAHALGPVLVALFANSRWHAGCDTGSASARWQAVLDTEPVRTRPDEPGPDPAAQWAARVLDTPLLAVRRSTGPWDAPEGVTFADWIAGRGAAGRLPPPTIADLEYHVTTLFTPVRPHGHLEIRYLDTQPLSSWLHPVVLLAVLLHRESVVDRVLDICAPVAGHWAVAARYGLGDPDLAAAARSLTDLGCAQLSATDLPAGTVGDIAYSIRRRLWQQGRQ